jgi:hypothetical protein
VEYASDVEQEAIAAAVEVVQERGPGLGRPLVDTMPRCMDRATPT